MWHLHKTLSGPCCTAHTDLRGLALAFLPALLLMSGPCPCSSHNLWLLPSLLLRWFHDGYSVSGYWPWHKDHENKCLPWLLNVYCCVPDPGGTKMNQRKSLPDRSSQWRVTRLCTQRIFTIWCDRCDPEGKPTLGPEEAQERFLSEEVFEVSWGTSTEI